MDVDEPETFQQQALEIREPGEDFDPTAKPQSGEEYLMHMMYERKRCPAIVTKKPKKIVANNDTNASVKGLSNSHQEEMSNDFVAHRDLLPTPEWKELQSRDFIVTRSKILMMRQHLTAENYDPSLEPPLITDDEAWLKFCREYQPKLSIILRLNQRTLEQLLEMLCDWLKGENQEEIIASSSSSAQTNTIFDLSSSDQWLGSWLYAVLACLHLPLEPGVHGTLRDIARTCIQWRSHLKAQEFEKAVPYNLFIYLIAKVFDQLDLLEFV